MISDEILVNPHPAQTIVLILLYYLISKIRTQTTTGDRFWLVLNPILIGKLLITKVRPGDRFWLVLAALKPLDVTVNRIPTYI